ncbi:hypothetical protein ACPA9J_16495 [Pseudomonas aeruginosa]
MRILGDQEIRDADIELRKSREALWPFDHWLRHRLAQERVEKGAAQGSPSTSNTRSRHWRPATRTLAREVAEKIATLEETAPRGRACPGRGIRRQRSPVAQSR